MSIDAPPPRGFVLSVPKAGTYLVSEILKTGGLTQTFLHVAEHGYEDYTKAPLTEGRRRPETVHGERPMADTLAQVTPGGFAVGHLSHSPEAVALLDGFRVVFMKRDLRACLVSRMRFQRDSGRAAQRNLPWLVGTTPAETFHAFLRHEGAAIVAHYRALVPWLGEPALLTLSFEELMGPPGPAAAAVERLLAWFGLTPALPAAAVLETSRSAETLTKSSGRTDITPYWDDLCEEWWRDMEGPELMRTFGYG